MVTTDSSGIELELELVVVLGFSVLLPERSLNHLGATAPQLGGQDSLHPISTLGIDNDDENDWVAYGWTALF